MSASPHTRTGPDWSHWPARQLGKTATDTISDYHGTHRLIGPEETWHAIEPLLDRAGITRVADLTWLDDIGIPTAQAVRPASLVLSASQGKGTSYRAAQISAVMEAMECWHAENVTPDLAATSAHDLGSELAYDPAQLDRPKGSLYHPRARIDWMAATTLLTGRPTWVPWASVAVNTQVHNTWSPPMFEMNTTGLASGNSYDEAALHATYEVMERHAMAKAEAGSTMFSVPIDQISTSTCGDLVDRIYAAGSQLRIARLDVWPDHPCFAAELTSAATEVVFHGSGLHHDPTVALSRAVTEAAQSRLTAISGSREDLSAAIYERLARIHSFRPTHRAVCDIPSASTTHWETTAPNSLPELLLQAGQAVFDRSGTEPLAIVCDFDAACVPVVRIVCPNLTAAATSPMRSTLKESA